MRCAAPPLGDSESYYCRSDFPILVLCRLFQTFTYFLPRIIPHFLLAIKGRASPYYERYCVLIPAVDSGIGRSQETGETLAGLELL